MSALLDLRAELETLLADDLGAYTFADDSTATAFRVVHEGDPRPNSIRVTGLEAVLLADPDLQPVRQYRDEAALGAWTLTLIAWDDVPPGTAAQRVVNAFPGTTVTPLSVPQGMGPRHQYRLVVRPAGALGIGDLVPPLTDTVFVPNVYVSGVFV